MAAVPHIFKKKISTTAVVQVKPYLCRNMALTDVLQALNNYEGTERFKRVTVPIPRTIEQFCNIFNEITNNSYIFLKVLPAAMHLFVRNNWFATIDCMHDNSVFVVSRDSSVTKTHIYNYIHFANQWWILDTQKNICDSIPAMQLGIGAEYCLIPVRKSCAEDFMETLKRWRPADPFYKSMQAGLIVSIYDQMRAGKDVAVDLYAQLEEEVVPALAGAEAETGDN
jgi:hypothetical protein